MNRLMFLVSIFLVSLNSKADDVTYVLMDEWYVDGVSSRNNVPPQGPESQPDKLLYENLTGFSLSKGLVYNQVGEERFLSIGRVQSCNGFQGKCLVIDGALKLFLPLDFDGSASRKWTWENYSYTTNTRKEYSLLGRKLNVTEILATCTECTFNNVRFEFDRDVGIISIKLSGDRAAVSYLLSSSTGFLSKSN